MRSLLFNSLVVLSAFLIVSCSYSNQTASKTASDDTVTLTAPDTTIVESGDTVQAVAVKGDSVAVQSTRVESTESGTTAKHPGAVKNPGENQAQTDSIKKAKTKGKKKKK
ncbi:MAG: hypothetical protein HQ542_00540 [Bacteroidia bacterium]|nr:hypothetical protein [Bacteroidia bacterium]